MKEAIEMKNEEIVETKVNNRKWGFIFTVLLAFLGGSFFGTSSRIYSTYKYLQDISAVKSSEVIINPLVNDWDLIWLVAMICLILFKILSINKVGYLDQLNVKNKQIEEIRNDLQEKGRILANHILNRDNNNYDTIFESLVKKITNNLEHVISTSIHTYSISHKKDRVKYFLNHKVSSTLNDVRSMYIGHEIYEFKQKNYRMFYQDLIEKDKLDQNYEHMIEQISKLKDDKESLEKQGENMEFIKSMIDETMLEVRKNEISFMKRLEKNLKKIVDTITSKNIDDLNHSDSSLRVLYNAYSSFLNIQFDAKIPCQYDKRLRRIQRTSIMSAILLGQNFYDFHEGVSHKQGRLYVFIPFSFNAIKYVISFSLNVNNVQKTEELEKINGIVENLVQKFKQQFEFVCDEHSLTSIKENLILHDNDDIMKLKDEVY